MMYHHYSDEIDEIMNRDPSTPPDLRCSGRLPECTRKMALFLRRSICAGRLWRM